MVEPGSPRFRAADRILIGIAGLLLVALVAVALAQDASPEWSDVQTRVQEIVADRLGPEKAAEVPLGLRQIWIEELDRVDRCVTCHATIDWGPELAEAEHPARSHPPGILEAHPIEEFGCTLCHGGQGWATTKKAAHGDVEFWEEPLLGERRAKRYRLEGYQVTGADLLEMRCNVCHAHQEQVDGMPLLNDAKAEVRKRRCDRCHRIQGEGASRAPDLTYEGDKHPSQYHFPAGWAWPTTALAWHIEHFRDPKKMSPETDMPTFTLDDRKAAGLGLLVLSWRRLSLPPRWLPGLR